MQKFKNWLITTLLKKDRLVAVPEDWQVDYVKTAASNVKNNTVIQEIIQEYNNLLRDYYDKCTIKELRQILANENVKVTVSMTKEELVELAVEEFKMFYQK